MARKPYGRGSGRGKLADVDSQRLTSGDDFRAQINVDPRFWAYIYGAFCYSRGSRTSKARPYPGASAVKNHPPLVRHVEEDIETYFREQLREDSDLREHIRLFIDDVVVPELRADAEAFLRSHGWEGP